MTINDLGRCSIWNVLTNLFYVLSLPETFALFSFPSILFLWPLLAFAPVLTEFPSLILMYKVLVAITLLQNRSIDDYHPRVQLKRIFAQKRFFFNESNNIQEFSKKFAVTEEAARNYVITWNFERYGVEREQERELDKLVQNSQRSAVTMTGGTTFCDVSLAKLKAVELDTKHLIRHYVRQHSTKKAKL